MIVISITFTTYSPNQSRDLRFAHIEEMLFPHMSRPVQSRGFMQQGRQKRKQDGVILCALSVFLSPSFARLQRVANAFLPSPPHLPLPAEKDQKIKKAGKKEREGRGEGGKRGYVSY